jgi:hypothetical protein
MCHYCKNCKRLVCMPTHIIFDGMCLCNATSTQAGVTCTPCLKYTLRQKHDWKDEDPGECLKKQLCLWCVKGETIQP